MLAIIMLSVAVILTGSKRVFFNSGTREDDKRLLALAFVMMVLVFGCRHWESFSGGDLYNYYTCYEKAIKSENIFQFINSDDWMDKGYLALNWLMSRVIQWPQFMFFFEAAFCCGITFRFIYKYSKDVLISVLGFMSLGTLSLYLTGFRQSMAISLCLLALEMAEKKKIVQFAALVLIAIALHKSAVVFLPVYFIMKIKVTRIFAVAEAGLLLLVGASIPFLIDLGNALFHRNYKPVFTGIKLGGIINITIDAFVIFTIIYQMKGDKLSVNTAQNKEENSIIADKQIENIKFLYILILGVGLYCMRFQASILERLSMYFTPVMLIMLPDAIQNVVEERHTRKVRILFIVGLLFLAGWRFRGSGYVFFLNGSS